jgi:HK97 family phage major capsid protein
MNIGEGLTFERAVDKPGNPNVLARTLYNQLLKQMVDRSSVMYGGATVISTSDANPIDFTIVTGRATAGIVAENGAIPESEPDTIQRSMGGFKYGFATALSWELVQDQQLDLVGFLVGDAGPAIGDAMGRHFLTGSGSNQPRGVFTDGTPAAATWAEGAATDEQIADALIDLTHELPRGYRSNARFLVSDNTVKIMRKLRDANGQFLWANGLTAGAPGSFNGYTVLEDPGVANNKVAFGDLSKYRVRMAGGLRVERSVDIKFMNDQIVYRFLQRADGLLVDQTAVRVLSTTA